MSGSRMGQGGRLGDRAEGCWVAVAHVHIRVPLCMQTKWCRPRERAHGHALLACVSANLCAHFV